MAVEKLTRKDIFNSTSFKEYLTEGRVSAKKNRDSGDGFFKEFEIKGLPIRLLLKVEDDEGDPIEFQLELPIFGDEEMEDKILSSEQQKQLVSVYLDTIQKVLKEKEKSNEDITKVYIYSVDKVKEGLPNENPFFESKFISEFERGLKKVSNSLSTNFKVKKIPDAFSLVNR